MDMGDELLENLKMKDVESEIDDAYRKQMLAAAMEDLLERERDPLAYEKKLFDHEMSELIDEEESESMMTEPCYFGDSCRKGDCRHPHPGFVLRPRCRYGASCKHRGYTCFLTHPGDVLPDCFIPQKETAKGPVDAAKVCPGPQNSPPKKKSKVKKPEVKKLFCKYGYKCPYQPNCERDHSCEPQPCEKGLLCPIGNCAFGHPTGDRPVCKYGLECTHFANGSCELSHVPPVVHRDENLDDLFRGCLDGGRGRGGRGRGGRGGRGRGRGRGNGQQS